MRASMTMKKTLGRLAAIVVAGSLWTAAVASPGWDEAAKNLRGALPAAQADAIVAQAQARGIPPASVQTWAANMQRAQQAGIPAALLGERLAQGLAKGVPPARIEQALATMQSNLAWAKQVIDRHAAKAEIRNRPEAVAQAARQLEAALRAGFARDNLAQALGKDALTLDQIAGLAGTAGNLRAWGVEPQAAVRALAQAAGTGMTVDELAKLEREFATGIAAGRAPKDLMAELERGIEKFGTERPANRDDMREQMKQDSMQDFRGAPTHEMAPGGPQDMGGAAPTPGEMPRY